MRGILQRYFEEEANFPGKKFFPRFFLNDVVRYWRTIAVDYAVKNNERGDEGWALRSAKLRFSRKLLYVAGLLLTYETTLFPKADLFPHSTYQQIQMFDDEKPQLSSTEHCFYALRLTPLELLARACINLNLPKTEVHTLFKCYDQFLRILDDKGQRDVLAKLSFDEAVNNTIFTSVRALGHEFQDVLDRLFLYSDTPLRELTLKYVTF